MPKIEDKIRPFASGKSTSLQLFKRITSAMLVPTIAIRGVAIFMSIIMASKGIAMSASPKPNVARTMAEKK